VLIGWQMMYGLKLILVSAKPIPPLFVAIVITTLPFLVWVWWHVGKIVFVVPKKPDVIPGLSDKEPLL